MRYSATKGKPAVPVLPPPDEKGNYWLGDPKVGPGILASKRRHDNGKNIEIRPTGKWFALVSADHGLLTEKDGFTIRYFETAQDALTALISCGAF